MPRFTQQEEDEMLERAKPLMKWMAENMHPHAKAIVDSSHIEIVEGVVTAQTFEFVYDGPTGLPDSPEPPKKAG